MHLCKLEKGVLMDRIKRYFCLLTIVALVLASCAKDEEEDIVKKSMSGAVTFDVPGFVLPREYVTAVAGGILSPSSHVFKWSGTHIIKDTLVGKQVTLYFPDTLGNFTLQATAFADGYYTSSNSANVSIIDTSFNASLSGVVRSGKSVKDQRDGHVYSYQTIGSLDWFTQNLAYDGGAAYRNAPVSWGLFGYFYHWDDVTGGVSARGLGNGPQGLCPEGWKVPTNEDWEDLAKAMNGGEALPFADDWTKIGEKASVGAVFMGEKMWPYSPDNEHTNDFGWNALPMGYTRNNHTEFEAVGDYGFWWSASEKNSNQAYYRYIYKDLSSFPMNYTSKTDFGASVRCVRIAR